MVKQHTKATSPSAATNTKFVWEDISATMVHNITEQLKGDQDLLWDLTMTLATPKAWMCHGEIVERTYRPPEIMS